MNFPDNQGIKKIVHSIGDLKAIIVCNIKILLPDAKLIEIQRDKKERADVYRILKLMGRYVICFISGVAYSRKMDTALSGMLL